MKPIKIIKNFIKRCVLELECFFYSSGTKHVPSHQPKVSVIMPAYNRCRTIASAIDSVIAQRYNNWELIIIDDGSTDETRFLIQKKYKDYLVSGKLVYMQQARGGVSKARNRGLSLAGGEWVAYLDTDNSWHPNFLNTMISPLLITKNRSAYSAVKVENYHEGMFHIIFESSFNWKKLLKDNYIDLNTYIHDIKLYHELGGFDETLKRLVDWDLILKYTYNSPPLPVKALLVDYKINKKQKGYSITTHESFDKNYRIVKEKWLKEKRGKRIS